MNIFITGGTGFIGRPIVKIIARHRHKILILSRDPKKNSDFLKWENLQFLKGDLSDLNSLKNKIKKFHPDVVLHLAWEGVLDYHNPENSIKNLKNSLDFLLFVSSISCKKIVCAGSGLEYGSLVGKVDESIEAYPSNIFEAAKVALHKLGREIAKKYEAQFIWARIFHSYGPNQRSEALIPYLVKCMREGKMPAIKNPNGTNDYIYVEDVARAIVKIVEKKNLQYDIYNIASGQLTSVRDIVNTVYGKNIFEDSSDEITGRYVDISRVAKELNWSPKMDIKTGIKKIKK